MKTLLCLITLSIFIPVAAFAQLGKMMTKYQDNAGVTVTRLDKSLYGLYKNGNLPPQADELLKNLDEVNILNLNLNVCNDETINDVVSKFKDVLNNKYRNIKSHNDAAKQQYIYARMDGEKVTDLVVWNSMPIRLDIIELKGNIQTENIAALSKVLNIRGLNSLSALSAGNEQEDEAYGPFGEMQRNMESMQREMEALSQRMDNDADFMNFASMADFGNQFGQMMADFGANFGWDMNSMFPDENMSSSSSSSVQIEESNGKTKIRIKSNGEDMSYLVDGVEFDGEEITMPEQIRQVRVVPAPDKPQKTYLWVMSNNKLGEFISFDKNVLKFKYNDKTYSYTLDNKPILLVNGRLTGHLNIDPSSILQIRIVSDIEKQLPNINPAEIIINTK